MARLLSLINLQTDGHMATLPVRAPRQRPGSHFGTCYGKPETIEPGMETARHVHCQIEDKSRPGADFFQPYTIHLTFEIDE